MLSDGCMGAGWLGWAKTEAAKRAGIDTSSADSLWGRRFRLPTTAAAEPAGGHRGWRAKAPAPQLTGGKTTGATVLIVVISPPSGRGRSRWAYSRRWQDRKSTR